MFSKKLIQLVIFKGVFWWLKSVMLRCLGLYERREAATTMRQGKGKNPRYGISASRSTH